MFIGVLASTLDALSYLLFTLVTDNKDNYRDNPLFTHQKSYPDS